MAVMHLADADLLNRISIFFFFLSSTGGYHVVDDDDDIRTKQ